ncbi:helix-turn-helix domain-containing protein [Streptomyces sp. TG1A-8]|uniref:helix-turn-helix domain-containing protein n=1 Tax=Streptomyces sp. TG1A-8 TaxID=3051385 RepID=UPI00265BDE09|nr:helix-turn-helix domain-containing protein [Streptomyces sp. TG1A-8]MDO0925060.1 helix-turn-helix domain-containing protein [Streptomyces sp. TG1A-8]
MTKPEKLGSRIRRLRLSAGLPQSALAGDNLSTSYISLLEAGKRTPSDEVLRQLAERLGCRLEELLGEPQKTDTTLLEIELRYAEMTLHNGDHESSLAAFTQVQNQISVTENRMLWFAAELGIARSLEHAGRLEEAVARFEFLRSQASQDNRDAVPQLSVVMALCRCYRELGDLSRAIEVAEATIESLDALKLPPTVASLELLSTLVGVYTERGDLHRAHFLASQAISQAGVISDRKALGAAYWNASVVLLRKGQSAEALSMITKAVAIYSEGEDERALARVRNAYAGVLLHSDTPDPDAAIKLLEQSAASLSAIGTDIDLAYTQTALARAELFLGHAQRAVEHAQRALDLLGSGHRLESARAYIVMAAAHLKQNDRAAARHAYERGALMLEASEARRQAAFAWSELAEVFEQDGESDRAVWAYREGMRCMGHRKGLFSETERERSSSQRTVQ